MTKRADHRGGDDALHFGAGRRPCVDKAPELNLGCFGISHPYIQKLIGRAFQIEQSTLDNCS